LTAGKRKPRKQAGSFETRVIKRLRKLLSPEKLRKIARRVAREERYTIPEVIEMLKKSKKTKRGKGRPKGPTKATLAKLERIAALQADGRTQYAVAAEIKMDYNLLRTYLYRNRVAFQQVKQRLK
jgi:DNA-binding NarL/FixJ family response regulator